MRLMAFAVVLAMLMLLCAPVMANDLGSIRGTLKMADGKTAVGGHAVIVLDGKGKPVAKAKTDASGAFRLASIPTGAYKVAATDSAFAVVQVPALPKVVEVDLVLPPAVYGQGVRKGGGSNKKPIVLAIVGGLVMGGVIGGAIGYNSKSRRSSKIVTDTRTVYVSASPSMP